MLIKNNIFVICLFYILMCTSFIYAEESCYIDFSFNERLVESGSQNFFINLSYGGLNNVYGNYQRFVNNYDYLFPEVYILNTYNSLDNKLNSYSFDTSLNIENIESPGGVLNSVMIPYDANINSVRVYFNESLLLQFTPAGMKCERICKTVGEFGNIGERCCSGLSEMWITNNNFTCTNCGNNICDSSENEYNCFSDCRTDISKMNCSDGYAPTDYGCIELNVCGNEILENEEECDILNSEGCDSNCNLVCTDYDASLDQIYNFSYVVYGDSVFEDRCVDDYYIEESGCAWEWRWDFWNTFKRFQYYYQSYCEFGCSNGRCLTQEEVVVSPINNTSSLPPEPDLPMGGLG